MSGMFSIEGTIVFIMTAIGASLGWIISYLLIDCYKEWRDAKRWCRENGFKLKKFWYGEGREQYWRVGEDKEGRYWMIPWKGEGEPERCIRKREDGTSEIYKVGDEKIEKRGLLTWKVVFGIAEKLFGRIVKKALIKGLEMLTEYLKAKWGEDGIVEIVKLNEESEAKVRGWDPEKWIWTRGNEEIEEGAIEDAKTMLGVIVGYAYEEGIVRESEVSEEDLKNILVEFNKKVKAEGARVEGEEEKEEVRLEEREETVVEVEGTIKEEKETEDKEMVEMKEEKAKEFADGYEERGW